MLFRGRLCLTASNGFPYAGGDVLEVQLEDVSAIGRLFVWRSKIAQTLVRLEDGRLVHVRLEEQPQEVQEWVKHQLRNMRPREPTKVQGWVLAWREQPSKSSRLGDAEDDEHGDGCHQGQREDGADVP